MTELCEKEEWKLADNEKKDSIHGAQNNSTLQYLIFTCNLTYLY